MAAVVKFAKTIRNNWKKTVFFSAVAAYGVHYAKGVYDDSLLRRAFCAEAEKLGNQPLRLGERARKVTVFLNPAARNGKSRKIFEKNVAPILYLAGMQVTVVKTEYEGQAKKYMDVMDDVDAIVVAGGDGTLTEVVTGILRRPDQEAFSQVPIGFIPLGLTNTMSHALYDQDQTEVARLLQAAWAVVTGHTRPIDVMAITGEEDKKVFAVSSIQWGPFREAELKKPRYKLFRSLKHRLAYMTHATGQWPPCVAGSLSYSHPCDGCSTCFTPPPQPVWRWWHIFLPPRVEVPTVDYSKVMNEECGKVHSREMTTMEFSVTTANNTPQSGQKALDLLVGPDNITKGEFISEGSKRHIEGRSPDFGEHIAAQKLKLIPEVRQGTDQWFSIDNELFELMPIEVELLKSKMRIFVPDKTTQITASS